MARVVVRSETDSAGLARILRPRTDVVLERDAGDGRFEAASGPVLFYQRTVDVVRGTVPGQATLVTQTVDFRLAVPYFGWLFVLPFKRALARPGTCLLYTSPSPRDS